MKMNANTVLINGGTAGIQCVDVFLRQKNKKIKGDI